MEELKEKIEQHYDLLSPYYKDLWGTHIHHGFWKTGNETKEEAQIQLIHELAQRTRLSKGMTVLDVGCGVGGTSVYLAKKFGVKVTGITISSVQVEMAQQYAKEEKVADRVTFVRMDAEKISFPQNSFDVVWISEALSHLSKKELFFEHSNRLLKMGGRLALADWTKAEGISEEQEKTFIKPIEEGMLLPPVATLDQYCFWLQRHGFRIVYAEDISENVKKTWDICLDLIKSPSLWGLAVTQGKDFLHFLRSFWAMRQGYGSKAFVYCLIVAEKVRTNSKL